MTTRKKTASEPEWLAERRELERTTGAAFDAAADAHNAALAALNAADDERIAVEQLAALGEPLEPGALSRAREDVEVATLRTRATGAALAEAAEAHHHANALVVAAEVAMNPDITGEALERAEAEMRQALDAARAAFNAEYRRIRRAEIDAAARLVEAGLPAVAVRPDGFGIDVGAQPVKAVVRYGVALRGKSVVLFPGADQAAEWIESGRYRVRVADPFDPELPVDVRPLAELADVDGPADWRISGGGLHHQRQAVEPGERAKYGVKQADAGIPDWARAADAA